VKLNTEGRIESKDVLDLLETIENAVYSSDRREIEYVTRMIRLPRIVSDAAKERLRYHKDERFVVTRAGSGSIVLEGAIAATALYVLRKTVGEALDQGFKKSETFNRMTEFFRHQIDEKAIFLVERMRELLHRKEGIAEIRHEPKSPDAPHHIYVEIVKPQVKGKDRIGTLGEELEK
jgi:hypothetical protein